MLQNHHTETVCVKLLYSPATQFSLPNPNQHSILENKGTIYLTKLLLFVLKLLYFYAEENNIDKYNLD